MPIYNDVWLKTLPPPPTPTACSFPFHLTCLLVPKTPAIFFCFTSPTMIYNWYSTRFSSVALETHTLGCHPGVSNVILMPFVFLDKWQFYCFCWLNLAFPMILHSPITVTMTITTVVNSIKAGVIFMKIGVSSQLGNWYILASTEAVNSSLTGDLKFAALYRSNLWESTIYRMFISN